MLFSPTVVCRSCKEFDTKKENCVKRQRTAPRKRDACFHYANKHGICDDRELSEYAHYA